MTPLNCSPALVKSRRSLVLLLALIAFLSPYPRTHAQTAAVHAVLFTSPSCTFCRDIVEHQLPPLLKPFGEQLQILYVNVETEEGQRLYEAALDAFDVPRGVPLVFIGETWLMGENIPPQFPSLVEAALRQGGADWPAIPGLETYLAAHGGTPTLPAAPETVAPSTTPAPPAAARPERPVVRAVLFWLATCPHCHEVLTHVLPPLQQQYGERLEIWLIELQSSADSDLLYRTAERYGFPPERVGVPFLVIGEHALIGSAQIPEELPGLIEEYLAQGGVDWPSDLTPPAGAVFFSLLPPTEPSAVPTQAFSGAPSQARPDGFGLAMAVLVLMVIVLLYSLSAFLLGKAFSLPARAEQWIPALVALGVVIAGYLSYVEIRMTEAVCGPVGDCNAVQSSPYARLFGVLPLGVFGLMGYLALLAAWWVRRVAPALRRPAALAYFAMALFGTIFSLYLTYLEAFVLRAVCLWCLSSAVIMAALLLLGLPSALERRLLPHPAPARRKVLFLCTGNSCRSQMAEAIVNARFGEEWQAFSAGTKPAGFVHPKAIAALAEIGIRHTGRSKSVDEFRDADFDLVVTVCDSAAEECPVWLGKGKRLHHGFPDPARTDDMEDFRRVRDAMLTVLPALLRDYRA